jgi:hypothetical protein
MAARGVKVYKKIVTVQGSGRFPTDMLRYDSCVPASEKDANALFQTEDREVKVIQFCAEVSGVPSKARWESFGWKITAVNVA